MRPPFRTSLALIEVTIVALLLAVIARPSAAQAPGTAVQDTTPLTLLFVIFPDETTAQKAFTDLNTAPPADAQQPANVEQTANVQWIEPYYAVASRDKSGNVKVQEHGKKGDTPLNARAENAIDGVTALLGERPGKDAEAASGAGASRAGMSKANMDEMQELLTPGKSALIIVVAQPDVADVTSEMKQGDATDVYEAGGA